MSRVDGCRIDLGGGGRGPVRKQESAKGIHSFDRARRVDSRQGSLAPWPHPAEALNHGRQARSRWLLIVLAVILHGLTEDREGGEGGEGGEG